MCIASFYMQFESHTDEHANCLIQELLLYKFELGHNAMETTRNICSGKGEGAADPTIVTSQLKKLS